MVFIYFEIVETVAEKKLVEVGMRVVYAINDVEVKFGNVTSWNSKCIFVLLDGDNISTNILPENVTCYDSYTKLNKIEERVL